MDFIIKKLKIFWNFLPKGGGGLANSKISLSEKNWGLQIDGRGRGGLRISKFFWKIPVFFYWCLPLHTISDQIVGIFSVELVVQEVQEGGPIFGVSTIPDFHPHPHNMLDLKRGELPEEVLSICDKLGISYTLGAYNNLSPTHDSCKSQREGSFYAPAQVWT